MVSLSSEVPRAVGAGGWKVTLRRRTCLVETDDGGWPGGEGSLVGLGDQDLGVTVEALAREVVAGALEA